MADTRTASRIFQDEDSALTITVQLALASQWFQFQPLPNGQYEVTVKVENEHLLDQAPAPAYALVQEGGSSAELYLHAHGSMADAEQDRISCAEGSYRTSPVIEVPALLDALGERFYAAAEQLVQASTDLDYGD